MFGIRMAGLILAAAMIFGICVVPASAAEYGLDDLYRMALEQAERIRISQENVFIAETNKDKALSVLIPRATAFGSYSRYTTSKYGDSSTLAPGVTLPGSLIQPSWVRSSGVRLDQSFSLSGREFTALSIAGESITKSKYDHQAVREDYLMNVAMAYYDVLKARKALDIANANVERLTKYRVAADRRLKVGEVTKTVLLRAQGELSGAQSDRLKAQNFLDFSKIVLARLTGISDEYTLREELDAAREMKSLSHFRDEALANRADLKSLDIQKSVAEKTTRYTKGAFWPSVSVAGVYTNLDQDPVTGTLNRDSTYGMVSLNFPFFEGGLRVAEVREARARERQAELQYEDMKKTVFVEVQNTYLDVMTQKGLLKFQEDQLAYAKDNMNAIAKQFEFGLASSLDVIDANALLVSAERKLAEAIYNYQFFMLRMKKVTGVLLKAPEDNKGGKGERAS